MFETLLELTHGDEEKAKRYLKMYELTMEGNLVKLKTAIELCNYEDLRQTLHDCKLMLSTVGLNDYYKKANSLEKDLRLAKHNNDTLNEAKELLTSLHKVQDSLESY